MQPMEQKASLIQVLTVSKCSDLGDGGRFHHVLEEAVRTNGETPKVTSGVLQPNSEGEVSGQIVDDNLEPEKCSQSAN